MQGPESLLRLHRARNIREEMWELFMLVSQINGQGASQSRIRDFSKQRGTRSGQSGRAGFHTWQRKSLTI